MLTDKVLQAHKLTRIALVGNKFQARRPNKNDKDILLIREDENEYDSNAVGVYSKNNGLTKLGYIIKDKTQYIRDNLDNINVEGIIRSNSMNSDNTYYYYLLIKNKSDV